MYARGTVRTFCELATLQAFRKHDVTNASTEQVRVREQQCAATRGGTVHSMAFFSSRVLIGCSLSWQPSVIA